jgi:hypothetical protein
VSEAREEKNTEKLKEKKNIDTLILRCENCAVQNRIFEYRCLKRWNKSIFWVKNITPWNKVFTLACRKEFQTIFHPGNYGHLPEKFEQSSEAQNKKWLQLEHGSADLRTEH